MIFPSGRIVSAQEFLDKQHEIVEEYPELVRKKITIRSIEELENSKCVFIEDGEGTFCVTNQGDIESVLKKSDSKMADFLSIAFYNAVSNGGNKLDCYNCAGSDPTKGTSLGDKYCRRGFVPVCRIRFNRLMVDPLMAKNYGEPEVIFFLYCGDSLEAYGNKLANKEYPGLSEYGYIPYVDEIQASLGIDVDDTDYFFAQTLRDIIGKNWTQDMKKRYNGDLFEYINMAFIDQEMLIAWLKESNVLEVFDSSFDGREETIGKNKHNFFYNNDLRWFLDFDMATITHKNLLLPNVMDVNSIIIGKRSFYLDYTDDGHVILCEKDVNCVDDDSADFKVLYTFNDTELSNCSVTTAPLMTYKDDYIWFIDKNEASENKICSFDPNTNQVVFHDANILQDVIAIFPVPMGDGVFIYFYMKPGDYFGEEDLVLVLNRDGKDEQVKRIGELIALNEDYVYSQYDWDYNLLLATSLHTFNSKKITDMCEELADFIYKPVYIDAQTDTVYCQRIIYEKDPYADIIQNYFTEDFYEPSGKISAYTRGEVTSMAELEEFIAHNEEIRKSLDAKSQEILDNLKLYRRIGDRNLVGFDLNGKRIKRWRTPKLPPDKELYGCFFDAKHLYYFSPQNNDVKKYNSNGKIV